MTAEGPLAEIRRDGDRTLLVFVRTLAHPPEKVWRALTESEHMRWWMPADMVGERSPGATVKMVFWTDLAETKGLDPDAGTAFIQVWDPPHAFEWIWHGSRIRFDLGASPDGCELRLTVRLDVDDPDTIVDNAGGYHLWMDHLGSLLASGIGTAIASASADQLQVKYRAQLDDR